MQKNSSPSVVFFGTPDFAVASLRALIKNQFRVLAVVTAPDKPAGRGRKLQTSAVKDFALLHNLPVLQPEKLKEIDFIEELKLLQADLHIVVAFRMLPEAVWDMPPLGTINVHASLLPQYRGAAPINHVLINGEKITGVTTFKLKHQIDTGDILLQQQVEIEDMDTFGSLYLKLMNCGADLLVETLEKLQDGSLVPHPQKTTDHLKPAPKIFREDCQINWNQSGERVYNFIRGLSPSPTAFTFIYEKKYKLSDVRFIKEESKSLIPGSVDTDNKTYLKIAANDGWISILSIQPEGKRVMLIQEFLNGHQF